MKKIYNELIKRQKGISLIALTTTILVLAIVTSIVVYNAKDVVEIREYKKLESDIEVLDNKVSMYYLNNEKMPVLEKDSVPVIYKGDVKYLEQKQENDNDNYYILNLRLIDGITLNFGGGFFNINDEIDNYNDITDIYIINEISHRIYYVDGIEVDSKKYYTIGEDKEISNIIYVRTKEELEEIRNNVNSGKQSYEGYKIIQLNDIDLLGSSADEWIPIGTEQYPFKGKYYGSGCVIKGLYINSSKIKMGLFGTIENATILNLGIYSGTFISNGYSGVIVRI